jgi:hypothetical protein
MCNILTRFSGFLLLAAFLFSCGSRDSADSQQSNKVKIDTVEYVVFSKRSDSVEILLTSAEIQQVDIILKQCIDEYNSQRKEKLSAYLQSAECTDKEYYVIKLPGYKRQYVPYINEQGQKMVWVNCLCSSGYQDWRTRVISVLDGGKYFFNVKVNLSDATYAEFMVNGSA